MTTEQDKGIIENLTDKLDEKEKEIQKLKDDLFFYKRENESLMSRLKNLKSEFKELLTNGWTKHEVTHFNDYLEEEIKEDYPAVYNLFKEERLRGETEK